MWCSVEVLQDWHAIVEALMDDQANEARGDTATTNLISLLAATVRTATGGAHAGTRTDSRCTPVLECVAVQLLCAMLEILCCVQY